MMAYRILRALGTLALRWFYRDIETVGLERLPEHGPVLLASNHPNALVDALVIGCTLRRPVTLTAKATLMQHLMTRTLLRLAGVVPLRRASDTSHDDSPSVLDPARNADAFSAVLDRLAEGGIVLLFPEGKSHSEPALAPLKTGLARIAIMAIGERRLDSIPIIPIGLTFERKWQPRSRVLMHLGSPVPVDADVRNAPNAVAALTNRVNEGLREVTLNFRSIDEASRVLSTSTILVEVLDRFRPLDTPDPPLADNVRIAQRLNTLAPRLDELEPIRRARVERFLGRVSAFEALLQVNGVAASDVQMSTHAASGAWFVARELAIAVLAGPLALWGRVNHWLPLRAARAFALKTSRTPDEPATNTIVAGLILVLVFYIGQVSLIAWWLNWMTALLYAVSLPLSATWDFRYADRWRRAIARASTYRRFRQNSELHQHLLDELRWLRSETIALDSMMDDSPLEGSDVTSDVV